MLGIPRYAYTGSLDHAIPPDKSRLQDKSVVITGGANGMGEEFVRQFAAAGSHVTFGDNNATRGKEVEHEVVKNGGKAKFVPCDITSWEDQVRMFDAAVAVSPNKSCDIVIANADPNGSLCKPALNIVNVNLIWNLYTFKLAVRYFRKQAVTPERDRCFVMTGSMTTYIDSPGNWEYTCTKYALRGLMRTVRRSSWEQGIRINYVAPCYIKSAIRTGETEKRLLDKGVELGYPEDAAACMMRIASDRTINGKSLAIVSRSVAEEGYLDAQQDDHVEDGYYKLMQDVQLRVIEDRWLDQTS